MSASVRVIAAPASPRADVPSGPPPSRRYIWHERRVNFAAHPVAWPVACAIRHFGRVVRVPRLGIVINDAIIAHDVLTRDRDYTKRGPGSIADVMTEAFGSHALANMDGDAHRELRQRLGPLASAAQAEQWLLDARPPFDHAIEALRVGERLDMSRIARLLSGRLTLTLMGSAPTAHAIDAASLEVHALGERIASSLQLSPFARSRRDDVRSDIARLLAHSHDAFARDDLPPESLVARLKALGCDAEETRGILSIFFVAGALTLGVALPRLVALLIDSGQLARLREDPALVSRAVDEGLRYTCPVPATVRISAHNTTLNGTRVHRGDRVVILTANLARDAQLFPDADTFNISRQQDPRARYLWYGAGPHFCLGFTLAQRVLQYTIEALASIPGGLRIVSRRPARGVLLPAWRELHVERRP